MMGWDSLWRKLWVVTLQCPAQAMVTAEGLLQSQGPDAPHTPGTQGVLWGWAMPSRPSSHSVHASRIRPHLTTLCNLLGPGPRWLLDGPASPVPSVADRVPPQSDPARAPHPHMGPGTSESDLVWKESLCGCV